MKNINDFVVLSILECLVSIICSKELLEKSLESQRQFSLTRVLQSCSCQRQRQCSFSATVVSGCGGESRSAFVTMVTMRRPAAVLDSVAECSATSDSSRSLEFIRQAAKALESGAATTVGVQASNNEDVSQNALPSMPLAFREVTKVESCPEHREVWHNIWLGNLWDVAKEEGIPFEKSNCPILYSIVVGMDLGEDPTEHLRSEGWLLYNYTK